MSKRRTRARQQRGKSVVAATWLPRPLFEHMHAIAMKQNVTPSEWLRRVVLAELRAEMGRQLEVAR